MDPERTVLCQHNQGLGQHSAGDSPVLTQSGDTRPLTASQADTRFFLMAFNEKPELTLIVSSFHFLFIHFMARATEFLIPSHKSASGSTEKPSLVRMKPLDLSLDMHAAYFFSLFFFKVTTLRPESCHLIFHKKGSKRCPPKLPNFSKPLSLMCSEAGSFSSGVAYQEKFAQQLHGSITQKFLDVLFQTGHQFLSQHTKKYGKVTFGSKYACCHYCLCLPAWVIVSSLNPSNLSLY